MYFDEKTDDTTDPWWKDIVPDVSKVGTIFVGGGTLVIFPFLIEVPFCLNQYKVIAEQDLPGAAVVGHSHTSGNVALSE
jgi:hypothetical protein